jgi:hypothetical protein
MPTLRPLSVLALLAAAAPAQKPEPTPAPAAQVAEWPALKDTDKDKVRALAAQFKKDAKLHADAKKQLIGFGDGAVPLLLPQVSDRPENAASNTKLLEVFDVLIGAQHATLIGREVPKAGVELRRYLVLRLCRFRDPGAAKVLESVRTDKDELTAFYAQLGLLGIKQKDALAPVLAYSKVNWKDVGPLVAEVLTPIRSGECGTWVFEAIAKAPVADQMAGLRLARYLMVKDHCVILRTYLAASDHTVKREAVNAARVLHGEQPAENLPVFQAIEQAKQWLTKI